MIWRTLLLAARAHPARPALDVGGRVTTYAELIELVQRRAVLLPQRLTSAPERVLVQQRDPFSLLLHVLTAWHNCLTPVVVRDSTPAAQVDDLQTWLQPRACLFDLVDPSKLQAPPCAAGERGAARDTDFQPREEALIICTSGTTGAPKLVALPAQGVCVTAQTIARSLGFDGSDRIAVNTPLGYMYGLMGGAVAGLLAGATVHLFSPSQPMTDLQRAIRVQGITVVQGPPSMLQLFMAYWSGEPFTEVRLVTTGGELLTPELRDGLERVFPNAAKVFVYGMTEAGPRISHAAFSDGGGIDGCIGRPFDHLEWRIDEFDAAPRAGIGRLVLRGPSMFLGYVSADGGYEGLDARGFFHSNDLVSLDEHGRLHFEGRTDRIFKSGGKLVSPEAIERALLAFPQVTAAHAFKAPHAVLGFVPMAEVRVEAGAEPDEAALRRHCQLHLDAHAVPRTITRVDEFRLAESGKRLLQ